MESNVIQQRVPVSTDTGHWVHVSDSPRHVRVMFGGETIADSKRVKLVREAEILPAYYFPKADVRRRNYSCRAGTRAGCPVKGEASDWSVRVGRERAEDAAWSYTDPARRRSTSLRQLISLSGLAQDGQVDGRRRGNF